MILVKTPFRISFAGGGSDIDSFYTKSPGAVLSTTIDKYMYIMIHPYFHDKIRIKYSKTEDVDSINEIRHPLVRECLKFTGIEKGIEIASISDVPAGTGLGSSSAFTVGLLNALLAHKGKASTKEWLARNSCIIEIDKAKEPIGKQDQYAVSFGGLNYICFNSDGSVLVEPISLKPAIMRRLESSLLMFYVGNERNAGKILKKQKEEMRDKKGYQSVCEMVKIAKKIKDILIKGDLEEFGKLMHEAWIIKRSLTDGISSDRINLYYDRAIKAGALGGKILGAGGGGFFLFYCKQEYQNRLRESLNLRELKFKFDDEGTKIVYSDTYKK
jgi:D-glycero-alpha-D-manno-heptose-7-phosphate kinase